MSDLESALANVKVAMGVRRKIEFVKVQAIPAARKALLIEQLELELQDLLDPPAERVVPAVQAGRGPKAP
jgi:hypothetical protein